MNILVIGATGRRPGPKRNLLLSLNIAAKGGRSRQPSMVAKTAIELANQLVWDRCRTKFLETCRICLRFGRPVLT